MQRLFSYVGDSYAAERIVEEPPSAPLTSVEQLLAELRAFADAGLQGIEDTCTYVVDQDGHLRVAPRRSEHVVCAGGGPVLAAGEIRFDVENEVYVAEVTNQSTGFCPDVTCWEAVAAALDELGIPRPSRFTREFVFRRCEECGERNIVKESWFVCDICSADVPQKYNF